MCFHQDSFLICVLSGVLRLETWQALHHPQQTETFIETGSLVLRRVAVSVYSKITYLVSKTNDLNTREERKQLLAPRRHRVSEMGCFFLSCLSSREPLQRGRRSGRPACDPTLGSASPGKCRGEGPASSRSGWMLSSCPAVHPRYAHHLGLFLPPCRNRGQGHWFTS